MEIHNILSEIEHTYFVKTSDLIVTILYEYEEPEQLLYQLIKFCQTIKNTLNEIPTTMLEQQIKKLIKKFNNINKNIYKTITKAEEELKICMKSKESEKVVNIIKFTNNFIYPKYILHDKSSIIKDMQNIIKNCEKDTINQIIYYINNYLISRDKSQLYYIYFNQRIISELLKYKLKYYTEINLNYKNYGSDNN